MDYIPPDEQDEKEQDIEKWRRAIQEKLRNQADNTAQTQEFSIDDWRKAIAEKLGQGQAIPQNIQKPAQPMRPPISAHTRQTTAGNLGRQPTPKPDINQIKQEISKRLSGQQPSQPAQQAVANNIPASAPADPESQSLIQRMWSGFKGDLQILASPIDFGMYLLTQAITWPSGMAGKVGAAVAAPVVSGARAIFGKEPIDISKWWGAIDKATGLFVHQPMTPMGQQAAAGFNKLVGLPFEAANKAMESAGLSEEQKESANLGLSLMLMVSPLIGEGLKSYIKDNVFQGKPVNVPLLKSVLKDKNADPAILEKVEQKANEYNNSITSQANAPANEIKSFADAPEVLQIREALKKSKRLNREQQGLYHQERVARLQKAESMAEGLTGEERFKAELSALKGEMEKVVPDFEPLQQIINQDMVNKLFDMVDNSGLRFWDRVGAKNGLVRLFKGKIPRDSEIALMEKVFGQDLIKDIESKWGVWKKFADIGLESVNLPRTIMASTDFSAMLRQGIFLINRPEYWDSVGDMFKAAFSPKYYEELNRSIYYNPWYEYMRQGGLGLTEVGGSFSKREEYFMSNLLNRIPVIRKTIAVPVEASNRAYVAFLNRVRADTFASLMEDGLRMGIDPDTNPEFVKRTADLINIFTGRASFGGGTIGSALESAAPLLNSLYFAPRLTWSRLMILNPATYIKGPAILRKFALRNLLSYLGYETTILSLAKMAGADVETDPTSADFGKIKINNTRMDISGGIQPEVRLIAQIISGKMKSSTTGKEYTIGTGYKPVTRADLIARFARQKLSPIPAFAWGALKGENAVGEPFNVGQEVAKMFTPMLIQDIEDLIKEDPELIWTAFPDMFGVSVQTYKYQRRRLTRKR